MTNYIKSYRGGGIEADKNKNKTYIYILIVIKKEKKKQRWNGNSCHFLTNSWVSCSVLRDNWTFDSLMKKVITTE